MKKTKTLFNLFAIIFVISGIMLTVYYQKNIYPFGNGTIAYGDMLQQTIPENLYYMWDVLHGKANAFFSWNSGFGVNLSGVASEQAYLSPLNLFIIFSSRENLLNFINLLMIIKMICIAISMYIYLGKYKVDAIFKIGASILYSFGAASLIHYNIMFVMDMAFLLPILMIGYDRILGKKKCGLFIAICTLGLIENVYMSFMVLLFVLIVSGIHFIHMAKEDENGKGYKEYAFLLGISVAVSIMISAVIVLPAMYAITNSSRVKDNFFKTYMKAISASWLREDWNMAKYMLVSLTLPVVICIYSFVIKKIDRKYYSKQLILTVLLLLTLVVNGTELLWHGGSRVAWPIRFVYIISFAVIDFSVQLLQDLNFTATKKAYWIYAAAMGILSSRCAYIALSKIEDFDTYKELVYLFVVCFCGFGYFCVLIYGKKGINWAVFLVLFELSSMTYLFIAPNMYNTNEYKVSLLEDAQIIKDNLPDEADQFNRVKNSDGNIANVNYSLVMGKESLANFIHVLDESFYQTLKNWGYSLHFTRMLDTGGTIFTDTLFGIQYIINGSGAPDALFDKIAECDGNSGTHYYIYRSQYRIPFIAYIEDSLEELSDDIFENQNIIFKNTTGLQENIMEEYMDLRVGESTVVEIGNRKMLYFYGDGKQSISIKVNGEDIIIPGKENIYNTTYPGSFNNNLICLGYFENQAVSIDFVNAQNTDGIHLGIFDMDIFEKGINIINDDLRESTQISRNNTGVQIELESKKDGYIFVPIFYDEGWSCKVNGSKEKAEDAFGFLKVPVQQGKNQIRLKYTPPRRYMGGMITIAGIVMCALFLIRYGEDRGGKYFRHLYNASYVLFVAVFGGVMILFYVIPILKYLERLFIWT